MTFVSIGDMAQTLVLRRRSVAMTADLTRLTEELSTGRVRDTARHLGGDTRGLASVEHALVMLDAYQLAARDSGRMATAMQTALGHVQEGAQALSQALYVAASGPDGPGLVAAGDAARAAFADMVGALNTRLGGRSLFSGAATDTAALAPAEQMLTALEAEIAGLSDPAAIRQAVQDWFAPGGGFDGDGYRGDGGSAGGGRIAPGVELDLNLRADDPALRATLAATALAALSSEGTAPSPSGATATLLEQAATDLLAAQTPLTALRSRLGEAEARIDASQSRNAAERTSLLQSREAMIGKDPYETASELEEIRLRLDALYRVTARNASLSLAEYL